MNRFSHPNLGWLIARVRWLPASEKGMLVATPLYFDEHVKKSIRTGLASRGIDVLTAQVDGMVGAPDEQLLERAASLKRFLVTHDKGFLRMAANNDQLKRAYAGIIYIPRGRLTIGNAIDDLEAISFLCEYDELSSRVTYLPL